MKKQICQPGARFASFQVDELIGRGGIGEVYRVTYGGKKYALKVIPGAKWVQTEEDVESLELEGNVLKGLKHPHIVEVHDTGVTKDHDIWIRMELLEGQTLRDRIHFNGRLSIPVACTVLAMIARGLHQAHLRGITHRDVKPENVFITSDETAKILDFGIMKLYGGTETKDGYRKGTPLYMAPEQIRGGRVTPASDVYSLGIVGIEALWEHPFVKDLRRYELDAVYEAHHREVPRSLAEIGIPKSIADIFAKAVEKVPERRYQSALEFGNDLLNAYLREREKDPSIDTRPHEPPVVELTPAPASGVWFGTGPTTGKTGQRDVSAAAAPAAAGTATSTGTAEVRAHVSGDAAPPAPPVYAKTEQLPASCPAAPRADTLRLPDAFRDPTCIQAKEGRSAAPHAPGSVSGWVPVQTTVRMPPSPRVTRPSGSDDTGARGGHGRTLARSSWRFARVSIVTAFAASLAGIVAGTVWMYVPGDRAPAAEANGPTSASPVQAAPAPPPTAVPPVEAAPDSPAPVASEESHVGAGFKPAPTLNPPASSAVVAASTVVPPAGKATQAGTGGALLSNSPQAPRKSSRPPRVIRDIF